MPYCGRLMLGRRELLLDDELLDGAGVAAVGLGPVRHHVAGLDELGPLLLGRQVLDRVGEGLHLGADLVGLGRELDVLGADHASAAEVHQVDGRLLRVDEVQQRGGAAHVQVGVVLPGDGDAAVHLGVEVGAQVGGRRRQGGGDGGRVAELVLADLGRHGRVPHGAGGELGGHAHVGAVVLHGLVHGDRPAELDALLGVGGGLLGALEGDAHRLGRQQQPVAVDEGLTGAGDDRARRAVQRDPRRPAGGVEVLGALDLHAVAHLHDGDVVADQHEQHVGEPATEHGAHVARRLPVRDRHAAPEGDGPALRPVSEAREVLGLGGLVGHRVEGGAGDHRGHEGPGGHGAAELLDHDDQLLEPEAGAAVRFGQVQTQPAQVARGRPRTGAAPRSRPRAGRGRPRGTLAW